jgi:hypothetical protein
MGQLRGWAATLTPFALSIIYFTVMGLATGLSGLTTLIVLAHPLARLLVQGTATSTAVGITLLVIAYLTSLAAALMSARIVRALVCREPFGTVLQRPNRRLQR